MQAWALMWAACVLELDMAVTWLPAHMPVCRCPCFRLSRGANYVQSLRVPQCVPLKAGHGCHLAACSQETSQCRDL